jgi:hypothetical protein
MSEKEALQNAADEARRSARAARELGRFLDDYAKYLSQRDGRERAEELHRLSVIIAGLASCDKWVIESGERAIAQPLDPTIKSGVSERQDVFERSKPRAVQIKKKTSVK